MINWLTLFANALWILSLALALSIISYSSWEAEQKGAKFKEVIAQHSKQAYLNISGVLFSTGLATIASKTWEQILWIIMIVLFLLQIGFLYFPINKD